MGRNRITIVAALAALAAPALAAPPLIGEGAARAIADTASGSAARHSVEILSRNHRMRGSRPYAAAAAFIERQAALAGLAEVSTISLPAMATCMAPARAPGLGCRFR